MGKKDSINELTNLLAIALRHKSGSIVNSNEIYASKYAKDADVLINEARKVSLQENWNEYDKIKIKELLIKKLNEELAKKEFLDSKKFGFVEQEVDSVLKLLKLS